MYSFVAVNSRFWFSKGSAIKEQFLEEVNIRLISQLINDISSLQRLLTYFNGIIISSSFVPLLFVCSVNFYLNLNELLLSLLSAGKSIMRLLLSKAGSSLSDCHKLPDIFE